MGTDERTMSQVALRIPKKLLASVQQQAKQYRRSTNAHILWLLERCLDTQEQKHEK